MSNEESFVILGTSPTSSMDTFSVLSEDKSLVDKLIQTTGKLNTNNAVEFQLRNSADSSSTSQYTVVNNSSPEQRSDNIKSGNAVSITQDNPKANGIEKPKLNSLQNSGSSNCSLGENLAASFILGEVNSTVLKSSLQSQFPNVLSLTPPVSDAYKPEDIVEDYAKLRKEVIENYQHINMLSAQSEEWRKNSQEKHEQKNMEIVKLRQQNLQLQNDLDARVEHFQIQENLQELNRIEQRRSFNEKQSPPLYNPGKDEDAKYRCCTPPEYVTRLHFEQVQYKLQKRISDLLNENKQLKEMQMQFVEEITCLKAKLVDSDELQKDAQSSIRALQENDLEKTEAFLKFEGTCTAQKDEIDKLRQKIELLSRDLKSEQEARANLANEKNQLLSDLRQLQKSNQSLIKQGQNKYERIISQSMDDSVLRSINSPSNSIPTPTYSCPLCARIFNTLSVLQKHVDQCL